MIREKGMFFWSEKIERGGNNLFKYRLIVWFHHIRERGPSFVVLGHRAADVLQEIVNPGLLGDDADYLA